MKNPKLKSAANAFGVCVLMVLLYSVSLSDVPELINYQGILTDSFGNPVTVAINVTFTIHDSPGGGTPIWTESRTVAPDARGRFSIILGEINPLTTDVFSGPDRWLELKVGDDPPITPLTQLTSVGYAHRIGTVDGSSGGTITGALTIIGETVEKNDEKRSSVWKMTQLMYGNYIAELKGTEVGQYVMRVVEDSINPNPNQDDTTSITFDVEDNDPNKKCKITIGMEDYVGINKQNPEEVLDIGGEPGVDGIRFPDGTKQTTAAVSGSGWWNQTATGNHIYNNNSGNVGIGNSSPDYKLVVGGQCYISEGLSINKTNPTRELEVWGTSRLYDTVLIHTYGTSKDAKAVLDICHYNSSGADSVGARISSWWNVGMFLNNGGGDADTKIHFQQQDTTKWLILHDGSDTGSLKINSIGTGSVLNLRSDGDIGIMKSPEVGYRLDVNGDIQCVNLNQTSDLRLKKNVNQLKNVLKKLDNIRGVSFEWTEKAHGYGTFKDKVQIGVIAQELESVFPELVSTPKNGYKSVDYVKLTAVLLEAIKELNLENEKLKCRLETIEKKCSIKHNIAIMPI
jgi:hypothetical protein